MSSQKIWLFKVVLATDVPHGDASDAWRLHSPAPSVTVAVELRTTERPIFDIAMDLGYVSQQTFSRVFRRQFDRTPSDYRHRL